MIKKYLHTMLQILLPLFVFYSIANAETSVENNSTLDAPQQQESGYSTSNSKVGGKNYVDGYLSLKWRNRTGGGDRDNDLYQTIYLNIQPEKKNDWRFIAFGRISKDLENENRFSEFSEFSDTLNDSTDGRLYLSYLEINNIGFIKPGSLINHAQVGRQDISNAGQYFHFDGLKLDSRNLETIWDFQLTAFGGKSANNYEVDSNNWLAGAGAQIVPVPNLRFRTDWVHVEDDHDEETSYGLVQDKNKDDLLAFSAWYTGFNNLRLFSRYTLLESEPNKLNLSSTYVVPEDDILIQITYITLLNSLLNRSNEFDPFTTITSSLEPYYHLNVNLWKKIRQRYSIDTGFTVRKLKDELDESTYNHDYKTFYLTHHTTGFIHNKLNLMLSTSYWKGGEDNDQFSLGGELNFVISNVRTVSGGVFYDLYKYNELLNSVQVLEKPDVYTYFARLDWKLFRKVNMDITYELEDSTFDNYHYFSLVIKYDI